MTTKGWAAPEVKGVYTRAQELCEQIGETPQVFPVLHGLSAFYYVRAEHQTGLELAEQQLRLAQNFRDPSLLLVAHMTLAYTLLFMGEFAQARAHGEQGTAIYDSAQHHALAFLYGGHDPGVVCLTCASRALFSLGYPDQALESMHEALVLSRKLSHPFSLAHTLLYASILHFSCGEVQLAQEEVKELIEVSADQGFVLWLACGTMWQGSLLAAQGRGEEGMTQIRQGLAACRPTGAQVGLPFFLECLATTHAVVGQGEEGLSVVAEALEMVQRTGEGQNEAVLYRLKGELTLQQGGGSGQTAAAPPASKRQADAEACFHTALEVARRQSAKSLELGAATSLARLWQQHGRKAEARELLSEIYDWFTEGFDTADLKDAKALLAQLA